MLLSLLFIHKKLKNKSWIAPFQAHQTHRTMLQLLKNDKTKRKD